MQNFGLCPDLICSAFQAATILHLLSVGPKIFLRKVYHVSRSRFRVTYSSNEGGFLSIRGNHRAAGIARSLHDRGGDLDGQHRQ